MSKLRGLPRRAPGLHVSLVAAVPSGSWVEVIPQLDAIASSRMAIEAGHAVAPEAPGLGIAWRWEQIEARATARHRIA